MKNFGDTDLKRLHRQWRRRTEGAVALLLDSVQTPFNVGAIVRLAAAERVEHLYLAGATPSPTEAKAAKTALGSQRFVTWTAHDDVADAMGAARSAGYFLLGLELADTAVPLHEVALPADVCVAVGHEDKGLSPLVLQQADALAFIPQLGRVASLNVAHAAAIAVYEVRRREWTSTRA